jgi:uncharacterized membrane protein
MSGIAGLSVGFLAITLTIGCSWFTVKLPETSKVVAPAAVPAIPPTEKPKADKPARTVEDAEKELAAAKQAEADAKKAVVDAHQQVEDKEKALADAHITEQQHKLYWMVGWSLFAALACVAGAIFLTGVRKYFVYGAIAAVGVAASAMLFAAILPYLLYIGIGLLVLGLGFAFVCWHNDHKGLRQVATAVETFKGQMPGYKEHFAKFIDSDVDGWLNKTRKKLGLLKQA